MWSARDAKGSWRSLEKMTYHEDVAAVKDSFKKMLENGVYKADLFSDL